MDRRRAKIAISNAAVVPDVKQLEKKSLIIVIRTLRNRRLSVPELLIKQIPANSAESLLKHGVESSFHANGQTWAAAEALPSAHLVEQPLRSLVFAMVFKYFSWSDFDTTRVAKIPHSKKV